MNLSKPLLDSSHWDLDPAITFLNNGSFGAPPREISDLRVRLLKEIEKNPLQALDVIYPQKLNSLRQSMAEFVGAAPEGFVFVPNATFGANAVLSSLPFSKDAEIVVFPHRYPAVGNTANYYAGKTGAKLVLTPVPASLSSPTQLVEAYAQTIGPHTELVIVDHISSLSGILFLMTCRSSPPLGAGV